MSRIKYKVNKGRTGGSKWAKGANGYLYTVLLGGDRHLNFVINPTHLTTTVALL